jgi:hypothetical protein
MASATLQSTSRLALATLRRYPIATCIVAAVFFAPLVGYEATRLKHPVDRGSANALLNMEWGKLTVVWALTMLLSSALAPLLRAVRDQQSLSLPAQLGMAAKSAVRSFIPVCIALVAIVIGIVTAVIPGLILFVRFWNVGWFASQQAPFELATLTRVADINRHAWVAALALCTIALDIATTAVMHTAMVPSLSGKLTPLLLHPVWLFAVINMVKTCVIAVVAALLCGASAADLTKPPQ